MQCKFLVITYIWKSRNNSFIAPCTHHLIFFGEVSASIPKLEHGAQRSGLARGPEEEKKRLVGLWKKNSSIRVAPRCCTVRSSIRLLVVGWRLVWGCDAEAMPARGSIVYYSIVVARGVLFRAREKSLQIITSTRTSSRRSKRGPARGWLEPLTSAHCLLQLLGTLSPYSTIYCCIYIFW